MRQRSQMYVSLVRRVGDVVYKMLRLRTALLLLLFVALADATTKTAVTHYDSRLLLVILALASWYVFGTSINDLADEAIDNINLKGYRERPLANKETTRQALWRVAFASGILSLFVSIPLGWPAALATLCALVLSYIYSMPPIHFSYRGILAPLLLPLGYVVYPCALTFYANNSPRISAHTLLLLGGLYMSFVARIILKDFRDVIGDKRFGKRTFIVRHGVKATCLVSATAWVLSFAILTVRFLDWPLLIVCFMSYVVAILYGLQRLSHEAVVRRQVQFVGLIGRLANGAALLMLTGIYYELEPQKTVQYNLLVVGVGLFGLSAAYTLYETLLQSPSKN